MQCRICLDEEPDAQKLVRPCKCSGTSAHIHRTCLDTWRAQSDTAFVQCPSCKATYKFEPSSETVHDGVVKRWFYAFVVRDTLATIIGIGAVLYLFAALSYQLRGDPSEAFPNRLAEVVFIIFSILGFLIMLAAIAKGGSGAARCPMGFFAFVGAGALLIMYFKLIQDIVDNRIRVLNRTALLKDAFRVADYDDPTATSLSVQPRAVSCKWYPPCVCAATVALGVLVVLTSPF